MKKLSLIAGALFASLTLTQLVWGACTVTVNWTPSTDTTAVSQEVYYDPDNTVGGDEVRHGGSLGMSVTSQSFQIDSPMQNDEAWIRTLDASGNHADSPKIPVGGLIGASNVTTITICNP